MQVQFSDSGREARTVHVEEKTDIRISLEDVKFSQPVNVKLDVSRNQNLLTVKGAIKGQGEAHCSNCLETFDLPVEVSVDEVIDLAPENDDESWDAVHFGAEGVVLDVDAIVNQLVLESLPVRFLCKENCRGICPGCGVNLNQEECRCQSKPVDPRLAALAKLLSDPKKEV
jgi:uncharacterized protein